MRSLSVGHRLEIHDMERQKGLAHQSPTSARPRPRRRSATDKETDHEAEECVGTENGQAKFVF